MTRPRAGAWLRRKALFLEALDLDPKDRDAFLDGACAGDHELRAEVESMLAAHERDAQTLEAPLVGEVVRRREPEPAADPHIGRTLGGKYRIELQLGRGGMGSVYRATHLWTGRTVAVKIIAPHFMANPEFVERFKREAKAMGRLRHPNVVNVVDFGFASEGAGNLAYLVMDYLEGQSLAALLRKNERLPLAFVVDVVEQ